MPPRPPRRRTPESLTGSGGLSVSGLSPDLGGAGQVVQDARPRGFYARITGQPGATTNAYAFARVDDGQPGTMPALTGDAAISGDGTTLAAYESTLRTDVPADGTAIVWLEPLRGAPGYGFEYAASSSSPLTTKGDLYTRDADADARLPVGANGDQLTPDSAQATGLKWVTPATVTTQTTVNGDPQTTVTQYAYPGANPASTPTRITQFTVDNDGAGTPQLVVSNYPAGTGGTTYTVETWTPTSHTIAYTVAGVTKTVTYSAIAGVLTQTYPSGMAVSFASAAVDFTGATVTGLSSGALTEGTLAALGTTQGTAAAITESSTEVTNSTPFVATGVILPATVGEWLVANVSGNGITVYPPLGTAIGANGVNTGVAVGNNTAYVFRRVKAAKYAYVQWNPYA